MTFQNERAEIIAKTFTACSEPHVRCCNMRQKRTSKLSKRRGNKS